MNQIINWYTRRKEERTKKEEQKKEEDNLMNKLCNFDSEIKIFPGTKEEYEELFHEKIEIIPLDYKYKYIHRNRYYSINFVRYSFCSARNPFVVLDDAEAFMLNETVTALIQYIPFEYRYYHNGLYTEVGVGIPVRKKTNNKEGENNV